jgi:acyl carrier protein
MVPSGFIGLSRLPLTASGKIDRKGLPEADIAVASAAYVAPRNATEALIAQIMRDVVSHDRLSLERVGLDDHFFDIGGHSIFAVQLAGRLERALGRAFPVRWVFETPTVRGLAQKLDETPAEARSLPEVVPADRSRPIPASFEQERMWIANQLFGDTPVYNEGLPLVLRGPMRTEALVGAVQGVLDRYESLRTRLSWRDGQLEQIIDPVGSLRVMFEDWSTDERSLAEREAEAARRASALIAEPYDLDAEPPCRALVIKLADDVHLWCLATHHVTGDNWSLSHVMPADFFALYEAHVAGRPASLPAIELRYADYAVWQRSPAMETVRKDQLAYWRGKLADIPEALDLPSDRPRPAKRDHKGARLLTARFSREEWRAIETFAVKRNATPFVVFVAGLSGLLHRIAGASDIVIGTPHTAKPDARLWPEFGYFGNTLALRSQIDGLGSFEALFEQARATVFEAFQNQDVAFEDIIQALGLKPANTTPVFQVLLVMHAFLDEGAFQRKDFAIDVLGGIPPR